MREKWLRDAYKYIQNTFCDVHNTWQAATWCNCHESDILLYSVNWYIIQGYYSEYKVKIKS